MDRREPGQESWGLGILTVGLAMAFPRQRVQGPLAPHPRALDRPPHAPCWLGGAGTLPWCLWGGRVVIDALSPYWLHK